MARLNKFKIDTDDQIARALLKPGTSTRRQLVARGNLAGIQYRRLGERIIATKGYDSPQSPFAKKKQDSILDKENFHVDVEGGKLIISVTAPAAEFVEVGNEPGAQGEFMRIQVKKTKVKKRKNRQGKTSYTLSSGTRIRRINGKYYITTNKVKPAKGYGLLRKAIRTAFRSL